jgi:hypothetical protein
VQDVLAAARDSPNASRGWHRRAGSFTNLNEAVPAQHPGTWAHGPMWALICRVGLVPNRVCLVQTSHHTVTASCHVCCVGVAPQITNLTAPSSAYTVLAPVNEAFNSTRLFDKTGITGEHLFLPANREALAQVKLVLTSADGGQGLFHRRVGPLGVLWALQLLVLG